MSDPFKKYVQENRDAFDHLEPAADLFQKIKSNLKKEAPALVQKNTIKLFAYTKWAVAACILIALTITYALFNHSEYIAAPKPQIVQKTGIEKPSVLKQIDLKEDKGGSLLANNKIEHQAKKVIASTSHLPTSVSIAEMLVNLTDSSSASNRLAAILEIQKTEHINNYVIAQLTKTLNNDGNSNVRLAALNLMSKYANDSYVSTMLQQSLSTQKDPLVQLGLINLLGQMDNVKIDDKLFALANDPSTFEAVKDQAYIILLNQNKL
ncbi:HEAT repeat domain-containing protein [Pedobacter sp. ASV28]|uniref:HEAT repeat domain-containing protein n=1 Tax=Pedobacter sp. ASV28 TaxID=2795123 RepID=UPI0018ED68FA|nr:HEAT repeat domain-containing protein [Pedobacter sp. ASV28]